MPGIIACPHCLSRVLPMANGRCPSCQRDTRAAKRSTSSKVTLRAGAPLPEVCVCCGDPAAARVTVHETQSDGRLAWPLRLASVLINPILYAVAERDLTERRSEMDVELPICLLCRDTREPPKPSYANFARRELTFVVHDRFAAALAELSTRDSQP